MIQNILKHIGDIERYGILSLCLFGALFVGVLIWALLLKPGHLEYMSRAALDVRPEESNPEEKNYE